MVIAFFPEFFDETHPLHFANFLVFEFCLVVFENCILPIHSKSTRRNSQNRDRRSRSHPGVGIGTAIESREGLVFISNTSRHEGFDPDWAQLAIRHRKFEVSSRAKSAQG
jgi:hypothetical protein